MFGMKKKEAPETRTPSQMVGDGLEEAFRSATQDGENMRKQILVAFCYGLDLGIKASHANSLMAANSYHSKTKGSLVEFDIEIDKAIGAILTKCKEERMAEPEEFAKQFAHAMPAAVPAKPVTVKPFKGQDDNVLELTKEVSKAAEIPEAELELPKFMKGKAAG